MDPTLRTSKRDIGDAEGAGPRATSIGSGLGMALLAACMRMLPVRLAYGFSLFPVVWYFLTKPEARRAAFLLFDRLGYTGGRLKRWRFSLAQIHMFAQVIMDNMYLGICGNRRFAMREFGTDIFLKLLEKGRGLLLLSAHVGNWHLAVNFLGNTRSHVHLVIDDVRTEAVRREMDAAKARSDHLTLHAADKGPELAFELTAALRRNEVVIIAGDRARGAARRTQVPFLGAPAWFPTAPILLAAAAGAPICTAFTFRTGLHSYDCFGLGPFEASAGTPLRDKPPIIVRQFAETLESHIRNYPTQWFNFYNFWN